MGESGHWYDPTNSKLVLSVPYADPRQGLRPTTLRDARKLGLFPSVTTILNILDKPGLRQWSLERAVTAALTRPRPLFQPEDTRELVKEVLEAADEYKNWAADFGTKVHLGLSVSLGMSEMVPFPDEIANEPDVLEVVHHFFTDWFHTAGLVCEKSEHSFISSLGYAGTVDFFGTWNNKPCILDFKCMAPTTKVLTRKLEWVPLDTLNVGDELVGFDEYAPEKFRRLRPSTVLAVKPGRKPLFRVELEDGSHVDVTADHPFLTHAPNLAWRTLDDGLKSVYRVGWPWKPETSYKAGWLAGLYDGEGTLAVHRGIPRQLQLVQNPGPVLDQAVSFLEELGFITKTLVKPRPSGFTGNYTCKAISIYGGAITRRAFLGRLRPTRLLERWSALEDWGRLDGYAERVVSVTPLGEQPIVSLETSSKTFIAEGLAVHNTQDFADPKEAHFYDEHALQLAGYAVGTNTTDRVRLSVVLSRSHPGVVAFKQWKPEDTAKWDDRWTRLWGLWQALKDYYPGGESWRQAQERRGAREQSLVQADDLLESAFTP